MENSEINLNRVYASEIEALKDYVAALYEHGENIESLKNISDGVTSLLRNEHLATPYFICRGGQRIGYVILTRYHSVEKGGRTIYIDELYVEEKYRRQGVGSEVMPRILEVARREGARAVWAQVERHNLAAQSFFTGHGFTVDPNINFERLL